MHLLKKLKYFVLLICISSCAQQGEDSIRLIPEGYQGAVLIIFNQEDGAPKEYEEGKRVYRIPENGVLKTQFKPNYGIQNHQFFYLNNKGERTEIPFVVINSKEEAKEIDSNSMHAYFEKTLGKVERYDPDTKELLYTIQPARTFYVGKLKDIDSEHRELLNFTFKHHKN